MSDREKDIRQFEKAADQRLTAANLLLEHGFGLEAIYLGGYSVECALKSLILKRTPRGQHPSMVKKLTTVGAKGHDYEYLKDLLKRPPCNVVFPAATATLLSRVALWSTELRYAVGLVDRQQADEFVKAATGIRDWTRES